MPHTPLTVESDDAVELILVVFPHAASSESFHGEGRASGQGVEAGQQIERYVRACRVCLLGAWQTDRGTQNCFSRI